MKKLFILAIAVVALATACNTPAPKNEATKTDSVAYQSIDTTKLAAGTLFYICPMPEDSFISDKPGTCPKCGMALEERKKS